jgi:hypothetical protein
MKPVWSACSSFAGVMVVYVLGVVIGNAVSTVRVCRSGSVRVSTRSLRLQGRFATRLGLLW